MVPWDTNEWRLEQTQHEESRIRSYQELRTVQAQMDRTLFAVSTGAVGLTFAILQWSKTAPRALFIPALLLWFASIVVHILSLRASVAAHTYATWLYETFPHHSHIRNEERKELNRLGGKVDKLNKCGFWAFALALFVFTLAVLVTVIGDSFPNQPE